MRKQLIKRLQDLNNKIKRREKFQGFIPVTIIKDKSELDPDKSYGVILIDDIKEDEI